MASQADIERTELALAFGAVVDARLRALGKGSKKRLGERLGQRDHAANSLVHDLLWTRKGVPSEHFADVAEFLGLRPSELLAEMAQWMRDNNM